MSTETLLSRLDRVKQTRPRSWVARCPAHDDNGPSLSVRETDDGRVLIHCFSGCAPLDVLHAVDLTFSDLFPEPIANHAKPYKQRTDYRSIWLLCRRAFYVLTVATENLASGMALSPDDLELVRASRRRISRVMELLDDD